MEPLISVIIPIYNMEAYLARCLDSVLNNTYRSLEVICVDDGSQDGSAGILRAYAEKDSRIVPIFKENGGVSSARNAGLDRMTGEYLSFIDPDDFVHPEYFELLYRALRESGEEIAMCGFQKVEEGEALPELKEIVFEPADMEILSVSGVFKVHSFRSFCWGKLFTSALTSKIRFHEDIRYAEDAIFLAELYESRESLRAVYLPYRLSYYYQRDDSMTKTVEVPQRMQATRILAQRLFESDGRDDIYLDHVLKRSLNNRFLSTHILTDRKSAKECRAILKKCRKRLWRTKEFSTIKKCVFLLMIRFPVLYWIFRIIREPYVLKWEKAERKKRREERKKRSVGNRS